MNVRSDNPPQNSVEYGLALLTFIVVSLLNLVLKRWVGYQAIALVYLLAVVLLALFVGRGPILLGTALTAIGWGYLFAPPPYSFQIGSFYDKMMLAMYFVVALTVAQLTSRLREERLAAHHREQHSRALYLFTRELADARDQIDILERVINQVGATFQAEVAVVFPSADVAAGSPGASNRHWALGESEYKLALEAIARKEPLGLASDNSPGSDRIYLPLAAGDVPIGTLAVRLKSSPDLDRNRSDLLENFAKQAALGLDRQRLRDAEIKTRLLAESERFGRTLLNSVSHELRTPLAAIATAADTLRGSGQLTPLQARLSAEIDAAIFRLNRVVQSLLNAARIQSGQVRPKMDWCDLADVLRATLRELGSQLETHRIERMIQPGLPLAHGDFVLLQQAVSNLLLNAVAYTPKASTIELSAEVVGAEAVIRVADSGPGLAPDQLGHAFDLFQRPSGSKPGGTGLGLAIVKGFIEAQGGRVEAKNRPEGGALFSLFIPLRETPSLPEETV
ncbi:MAG TPA: ATP-binding protein [Verrucomicrobiae bacterium]|nr:ATP-binding protein [Verrucomicrobiae bacterium]